MSPRTRVDGSGILWQGGEVGGGVTGVGVGSGVGGGGGGTGGGTVGVGMGSDGTHARTAGTFVSTAPQIAMLITTMSHFVQLPRMAPSPWFHTTSVRIGIIGIGISTGPRSMKRSASTAQSARIGPELYSQHEVGEENPTMRPMGLKNFSAGDFDSSCGERFPGWLYSTPVKCPVQGALPRLSTTLATLN